MSQIVQNSHKIIILQHSGMSGKNYLQERMMINSNFLLMNVMIRPRLDCLFFLSLSFIGSALQCHENLHYN